LSEFLLDVLNELMLVIDFVQLTKLRNNRPKRSVYLVHMEKESKFLLKLLSELVLVDT
jgi:hypothetical protein